MRFFVFALLAIAVVYGQEGEQICKPGIKIKEACNDCICSDDGKTKACTLMLCPETFEITTHDEKSKDASESHKSTDASKLVTDSLLLRQRRQVNNDKPCQIGEKVKVYCNSCSCGADGKPAACTRMQCPEGFYNEDGSLTSFGKAKTQAVS